jgi:hypothetical protein
MYFCERIYFVVDNYEMAKGFFLYICVCVVIPALIVC